MILIEKGMYRRHGFRVSKWDEKGKQRDQTRTKQKIQAKKQGNSQFKKTAHVLSNEFREKKGKNTIKLKQYPQFMNNWIIKFSNSTTLVEKFRMASKHTDERMGFIWYHN